MESVGFMASSQHIWRVPVNDITMPNLGPKGIPAVASEEERIRELVELIAAANGTPEMIALASELHDLLKTRKKHQGNPPAKPEGQ
jgi:hypothetical protein